VYDHGVWRWVILVVAGCGRVGFDPVDPIGGGDGGTDGPAVLGPCTPFGVGWTLDPPQLLDLSLPTAVDAHPYVSPDGLEIYFLSDRAGSWDVYRAQRSIAAGPFGAAELVPELSSPAMESGVALSANGLEVLVSTDRAGGPGNADIWRASRTSDGPFTNFAPVASLSTASWDYEPTMSRDGTRVYFVTENFPQFPGGGDPVVATRVSDVMWGPPQLVASMASDHNEYGFTMSADELVEMVSTDRDAPGVSYDIYVSNRASVDVAFPPPRPFAEINSAADDGHAFLTDDGCEVFFDSLRSGNGDLYVARWHGP